MAANRAASRPPSAIRLETSKSVMNRFPVDDSAVKVEVELGSKVDNALALSSAVGIRMLQPTCTN